MRIGIDLGGTNIAAALVDENMQIIVKKSVPTLATRPFEEVAHDMGNLALDLIKEAGIDVSEVSQIGIGAPGTPVKETGEILYSNNLNWYNVPLVEEIRKVIDLPIKLDNDANAAALGEALAGAAKGASHCVLVTLGTGVGGGIIIDGKVYDGINHAGAEIGHTVLVSGGEKCTCGRRGCWEAYASATALIRMGNAAAFAAPDSILAGLKNENGTLNGYLIFLAADKGCPTAQKVIDQYLFYVAEGIIDMINVFQPQSVVIGGGICAQGERILAPIREHVKQNVFCKQVALPEIVCAQLGNDAGIIGAAFL